MAAPAKASALNRTQAFCGKNMSELTHKTQSEVIQSESKALLLMCIGGSPRKVVRTRKFSLVATEVWGVKHLTQGANKSEVSDKLLDNLLFMF